MLSSPRKFHSINAKCSSFSPRLLCGLALCSWTSGPALWAADLLPAPSYDAGSLGGVAPAAPEVKGTSRVRMDFERRRYVNDGASAESKSNRIERIDRAQVLLGASVHRRFFLSLGFVGTSEALPSEQRFAIFPQSMTGSRDFAANRSMSLSGATFAGRYSLWSSGRGEGLHLGILTFLETGAGGKADDALTQSVSPRGGGALLAQYGSRATGEVSANVGLRYRSPEDVGPITLRHEIFYRAATSWPLEDFLHLYGALDGRQVMIRSNGVNGSASVPGTYAMQSSTEGQMGLALDADQLTFSLYGGRRLGSETGIGTASSMWGGSVSLLLGARPKSLARLSPIRDWDQDEGPSRRARSKKGTKLQPGDKAQGSETVPALGGGDRYDEMDGHPIDPLDALGAENAPDFKNIKKRIEVESRKDERESEDARIERELRELKEAKARAEEAAAREQAKEEDAIRAKSRREAVDEAKKFKKWTKEAKDELSEFEGIQAEDVNWKGLED